MKMSGNTIAITGGGSGIGRQLALRLSEFGNRIIVAGRRKESLEETIAGRPNMHALVLDVDDPESIESFVTRLVTEHPALNVLINNAGIMRQERLTGRWDLRDSEQTILTNLLGPWPWVWRCRTGGRPRAGSIAWKSCHRSLLRACEGARHSDAAAHHWSGQRRLASRDATTITGR